MVGSNEQRMVLALVVHIQTRNGSYDVVAAHGSAKWATVAQVRKIFLLKFTMGLYIHLYCPTVYYFIVE